jgi:hypothetical protein
VIDFGYFIIYKESNRAGYDALEDIVSEVDILMRAQTTIMESPRIVILLILISCTIMIPFHKE